MPTFLPLPDQVRDQARAAVRLARAGRPLDDEVRALEPVEQRPLLRELAPLQRRAAERRLAPQQPLEMRVAAVAGENRRREPAQRRLLRLASGTARRERATSGAARRACSLPRTSRIVAGRVVDRGDRPAGAALARILAAVALVEVVLLRAGT